MPRADAGPGRSVIIVGGGASGVMLAAALLRSPGAPPQITLIEQSRDVGPGLAYSTEEPDHILNTRAGSMSAVAEDPDHFLAWLQGSGAPADPFCFVSRQRYGAYLRDLLTPSTGPGGPLALVRGEATALRQTMGGVVVDLADGTSHVAQTAVLATGHDLPSFDARSPYVPAWTPPSEGGIGPDDPVLILGTGLSMVDYVIQLANEGHTGRIVALSRRGLLPRVHRRNAPLPMDAADIPFGADVSPLLRWLRRTVAAAVARGHDWRDVIDGLRPHTQALWQSLPPAARARFLRHARAWWEVHRHRIPPESEVRLRAAAAVGNLRVLPGRFLGAETTPFGVVVDYRRRGSRTAEAMMVAKIVDCTGILRDPAPEPSRLLGMLLDSGLARMDPLKIGLDFDGRGALIARGGLASTRIFGVGPITRSRFWEVTAVPDIRNQCARLVETLRQTASGRLERANG